MRCRPHVVIGAGLVGLLAAGSVALAPPAARLTDFHEVPMVTPSIPPVPGVGCVAGVSAWTGASCVDVGPGAPSVYIGGLPAARIGRMLVVVGPPAGVADAVGPGGPCVAGVHPWTGAACLAPLPSAAGRP